MAYEIFISHAGVDNFIAWKLSQDAKCGDVEVFLDEKDVLAGQKIEDRILDKIASANELWILLTPCALLRSYIWLEVGAFWMRIKAADGDLPIVPFLYQVESSEIQNTDNVPSLVKQAKMVQINQLADYEEFIRRFREDHP